MELRRKRNKKNKKLGLIHSTYEGRKDGIQKRFKSENRSLLNFVEKIITTPYSPNFSVN